MPVPGDVVVNDVFTPSKVLVWNGDATPLYPELLKMLNSGTKIPITSGEPEECAEASETDVIHALLACRRLASVQDQAARLREQFRILPR
jgi:hypothetical protein